MTSPSIASGILLGGKYRVERTLGTGGMGVVLAATNEALRQRVAIKLLRSGTLANAKALGRFEREARAAAKLRSEHVARVLDVGKFEDGRPFMVMEYLEGQDLGHVIDKRNGHLPIADVIEWVLQACEAIAEAHGAGIIHRDLKPSNLFLTTTVDGRACVKVLDFGISKVEDEAAEDLSLTKTTEVIGSPSYMSPEQLKASRDVDARTDIWALGVILYELITGKLPFSAETVTALVAIVMTEEATPIAAYRDGVPEPLARTIAKCLSRNREDRFASVVELVDAIAPYGNVAGATLVERVRGVAAGSGRSVSSTGNSSGTLPPAPSSPDAAEVGDTVEMDSSSIATPRSAPPGAAAGADGIAEMASGARPPTSSARLHIHGGTSVAWGETQVDAGARRAPPRSKWPLVAAAAGLALALGGAGTGAVYYVKRAGAKDGPPPLSLTSAAPPVATAPVAMALPDGRKDLPPADNAAAPVESELTPEPPALPTTRGPTSAASARTSGGKAPSARPGLKPGGSATAGAGGASPAAPPSQAPGPTTPTRAPDDLSGIGRR